MKFITQVFRIFVGVLFIISGLIKLNDPIGFSFKLEEYFGPTVLDLPVFIPYALVIAIFVVIYEVLLGVFLLLGFKTKFTLWSLLLMILFFTFLTFYSAYFNKVTDCGCFGDALKLTPWQSFGKDIILLGLILFIFFKEKFITPLFNSNILKFSALFSLMFCMWFAYYVLNHLPFIDFRPFKIGNNIEEKMILPLDAPKDIIDYNWEFEINGKKEIITTRGSYPKSTGQFINVTTEVVQKGYEPPIHDFSIELNGNDYTKQFFKEPKLVVFILYSIDKTEGSGIEYLVNAKREAIKKGYKVIGLSASSEKEINQIKEAYDFDLDFYFCDETALKTIIRSNPGVLVLNEGTIAEKAHWLDFNDLKLN